MSILLLCIQTRAGARFFSHKGVCAGDRPKKPENAACSNGVTEEPSTRYGSGTNVVHSTVLVSDKIACSVNRDSAN